MEWLFILGGLVWLLVQHTRIAELKGRVAGLEMRLVRAEQASSARTRAAAAEPTAPAPALAPRPTAPPPAAPVAPQRPTEPAPRPASGPAIAAAQAARKAAPPREPGPSLSDWLAENGLAWLGGGALALGGLFLVTYAAQRGFFTPPMRIAAAVLVGLAMLAAGEWIRRLQAGGGHKLAAAATSGAGAATLYGAVWASYWLYSFIGFPAAAALLALISGGLLALAWRHGEPLGLLALGGAYLAPALTHAAGWSANALLLYLLLILATGLAAAAERGWGRLAIAAMVGALAWQIDGVVAQDLPRAGVLAIAPAVLSLIMVEAARRLRSAAPRDPLLELAPFAALVGGALLSLLVAGTPQPPNAQAWAAAIIAVTATLGVVAAARSLAAPMVLLAPYIAAPAFIAFTSGRAGGALETALAAVIAIAGLTVARLSSGQTDRIAASLAAPAALACLALVSGVAGWPGGFGLLAGGAALTAAGAWVSRKAEAVDRDLPTALWIWSGSAAVFLGLAQTLDGRALPPALALLAAALAGAHARLGWRGFAASAIGAAVASFGALLGPRIAEAALEGRLPVAYVIAIFATAGGLIYLASRLARAGKGPRETGEALSTGALLVGLLGGFLLLRMWAAPAGGSDLLTEASLRSLLLLAAGLLSATGAGPDPGRIARWRPHAFLGLGLAHVLGFQVLGLNPWWSGRPVLGPPLIDSVALAFLAPALVVAFATRRQVSGSRALAGFYFAASFSLGVLWSLTETRRLFAGPLLHEGAVERPEQAAYALILLLLARGLAWAGGRAGRSRWSISEIAQHVEASGRVAAFIALGLVVLVFGLTASPWWGPDDRPLASHGEAALLFGLYLAAAAAALEMARHFGVRGLETARRVALSVSVFVQFVLITLLLRYAFRGLDMGPDQQEARIETWAFSAAWAVFGAAVLSLGAARRDLVLRWAGLIVLLGTLAKVLLFDMARLDGVVRAASFLAVGALLVGAALLARRLGAGFDVLGFGRRRERVGD